MLFLLFRGLGTVQCRLFLILPAWSLRYGSCFKIIQLSGEVSKISGYLTESSCFRTSGSFSRPSFRATPRRRSTRRWRTWSRSSPETPSGFRPRKNSESDHEPGSGKCLRPRKDLKVKTVCDAADCWLFCVVNVHADADGDANDDDGSKSESKLSENYLNSFSNPSDRFNLSVRIGGEKNLSIRNWLSTAVETTELKPKSTKTLFRAQYSTDLMYFMETWLRERDSRVAIFIPVIRERSAF